MLFPFGMKAQLSDYRKFQLDSITTNIPQDIRKNLDKVHHFLDSIGENDEEKVWLFYGYIGTYFKYDYVRFKQMRNIKEYNPEYTAQKGSGVCRDFGKLFYVLCQKSGIPCIEVHGKAPMGIFMKIKRWIHRISNSSNHEWNIVRINGEWQLMDPTWTSIEKTERIKTWIPKKKSYKVTLVKSVSRKYYNPAPEFMMETHKPIHPAFFLLPKVYTYKTAMRKDKRKRVFAENYPFAAKLDSIYANKFPAFSRQLNTESEAYSHISMTYYEYRYELALPFLKTANYNPLTVEGCDKALAHVDEINAYLKEQSLGEYRNDYIYFIHDLADKRYKIAKIAAAKKKKR